MTVENPYAPPTAAREPAPFYIGPESGYRGIAFAQGVTSICFLIYVGCFVAGFFVTRENWLYLAVASFCDMVVMTVAVFFLSVKLLNKFWNLGLGLLIVMFLLYPPGAALGLMLLALLVNLKAARLLKANGYTVGIFGATPPRQ
jgi:hypothetical protein